jgi:uncharacterized protein (TIGR03437 family)
MIRLPWNLLPCLSALFALAGLASAQSFDASSNSTLSGPYFIRELLLSDFTTSGDFARARSLSGVITFDGDGNYSFTGQLADSSAQGSQAQAYSVTGRYSVAPNGLAQLWPLIDQDAAEDRTIYGAVSQSVFAGSTTEGSVHDIVIAIQGGNALANSNVRGTYAVGTLGFPQAQASLARDAYFTLAADGQGNFASFNVNGSAADMGSASVLQTISGATYSLSGNTGGTATFPSDAAGTNGSSPLFGGDKLLYVSADGNFILGGDPNGFDIYVGIRPASSPAANTAYQGTYFTAGLEDDASSLDAGLSNIDSYYGSTNAFGQGEAVNHLRLSSVLYGTYDYTYDLAYNVSPDATIPMDSFFYQLGEKGQAVIVVGQGSEYHLTIGVHAPSYTGPGVFLNPIGIVNAASLAPVTNPVAPNELVTLYGSGLAPKAAQAKSLPLPTSGLGGVQVLVNNRPAATFYVSPTQVSAIVPSATAEAYATFQIINHGEASNKVTLYTSPTAPGVFAINQAGFGPGAVLHADYTLVTAQSPARTGEVVLVFLTGLGATKPPVPDGAAGPVQPLSKVTDPNLQVFIDGENAPILFAGLAPGLAGLYQLNVQVPPGVRSGDDYLDISTSVSYQSQTTIAIH